MTASEEKDYGTILAEERTDLAESRTSLAENRTFQAAERTYSAWIRTGFTIASAGLTLGKALQDTESGNIALFVGGSLIAIGMLAFVYAWLGYKAVYDYLRQTMVTKTDKKQPFTMNLTIVTILTLALLIICIFGFWIMLF